MRFSTTNSARLLTLLLPLLKHVSCYPDPYKQADGPPALRDGIEPELEGLTGTAFQVLNYQPVCGTLATSMKTTIDLSGTTPAFWLASFPFQRLSTKLKTDPSSSTC
jgi:hypothetical protein